MKKTNLAFYLLPKSRWIVALFVAACSLFAVNDAVAQSVVLSEVEVANLIPQVQDEIDNLEISMKSIDPSNKAELNKVKGLIAFYQGFVRTIKQQIAVDQTILDNLFSNDLPTILFQENGSEVQKLTPPKG